ncbi:MAG TPA: phosphoesterase, partial [bacterium]
ALLERTGRVLAAFAGHMHWTRAAVINRIPYVTLGSLVDCGYTGGRPAGTFAAVTIRGRSVEVRVSGLQPEQFHFGTA